MRIAQYKDVAVNARYDSGMFKGFNVMVLSDRSYAPRGLDEYLSREQIDGLAAILAAAAESIIRATEYAQEESRTYLFGTQRSDMPDLAKGEEHE